MNADVLSCVGICYPPEARLRTEVEEEADLEVGRSEVIQQLRLVGRVEHSRCLELKDYDGVHHQVRAERPDVPAPEDDVERDL